MRLTTSPNHHIAEAMRKAEFEKAAPVRMSERIWTIETTQCSLLCMHNTERETQKVGVIHTVYDHVHDAIQDGTPAFI